MSFVLKVQLEATVDLQPLTGTRFNKLDWDMNLLWKLKMDLKRFVFILNITERLMKGSGELKLTASRTL